MRLVTALTQKQFDSVLESSAGTTHRPPRQCHHQYNQIHSVAGLRQAIKSTKNLAADLALHPTGSTATTANQAATAVL
jgi:hypothetical protein